LFTIHIDDLDDLLELLRLIELLSKFADDTKGAKIVRNEEDARKLQMALDRLSEWAHTYL
jgi:hypothetical protein